MRGNGLTTVWPKERPRALLKLALEAVYGSGVTRHARGGRKDMYTYG